VKRAMFREARFRRRSNAQTEQAARAPLASPPPPSCDPPPVYTPAIKLSNPHQTALPRRHRKDHALHTMRSAQASYSWKEVSIAPVPRDAEHQAGHRVDEADESVHLSRGVGVDDALLD
jgi:hypothetical protein